MLRLVFLLLVVLALVAAITGAPGARRALWVALGLVLLYAALKLTGVIDALAPSRTGVF
jgi:hypothetical protein